MHEIMPLNRRSYNPFAIMDEVERSIFDQSAGEPISFKTDIRETKDGFELKADMPGFKKEDIDVSVDGDILTIRAERSNEHDEKDDQGNYIRRERSYGAYSRSFDVSNIEVDDIKVSYEDGVLTLDMPKHVDKKPEVKKLTIE